MLSYVYKFLNYLYNYIRIKMFSEVLDLYSSKEDKIEGM